MTDPKLSHVGGVPLNDLPILVVSPENFLIGYGMIEDHADGPRSPVVTMIVKVDDLTLSMVVRDPKTMASLLAGFARAADKSWPCEPYVGEPPAAPGEGGGRPTHRSGPPRHGVPRQRKRRTR